MDLWFNYFSVNGNIEKKCYSIEKKVTKTIMPFICEKNFYFYNVSVLRDEITKDAMGPAIIPPIRANIEQDPMPALR